MGAASYDGMAAGLDFFAKVMMGRQDMKDYEKRQALAEAAQEEREIKRETRAAAREEARAKLPSARSGPYKGVGADGPSYMVDRLNSMGEVVDTVPASAREARQSEQDERSANFLAARADEDRERKWQVDSKKADAAMIKAQRPAAVREPAKPVSDGSLSIKDANAEASRLQGLAQKAVGEDGVAVDWRDYGRSQGYDVDGIIRAMNKGRGDAVNPPSGNFRDEGGVMMAGFDKAPSATRGSGANQSGSVPPVPGARKSPKDGKWYVQQDGKWMMIE